MWEVPANLGASLFARIVAGALPWALQDKALSSNVANVCMFLPCVARGTGQVFTAAGLMHVCVCFDLGGSRRCHAEPAGAETFQACLCTLMEGRVDGVKKEASWL